MINKKGKLKELIVIALVLSLTMISISCNSGTDPTAGGGIGGTGKYVGVISGFGSVFVNGVEFDTSGAKILVEGTSATEAELYVGMKVQVEAVGTSAKTIVFEPDLVGDIQGIDFTTNTLTVLGQTVQVDLYTIFDGIADITGLNTGDTVKVSGFFMADGSILATYIKRVSIAASFKISGYVSNLDTTNKTFQINTLLVDYSQLSTPPSFDNGTLVAVKGYISGNLFVATELNVIAMSFNPGEEVEIEGVITTVLSQTEFEIQGLRVRTTPQTSYRYGNSADIAVDVRVEVEGTVESTGVIVAGRIEFKSHSDREISIAGNVEAVDPHNQTLLLNGVVVHATMTTVFLDQTHPSMPFSLSHIQPGDFVEVSGFVDQNGAAVAMTVERESAGEIKLMGPVDSPDQANFILLGVHVDTSGVTTFLDENDNPITRTQFFSSIKAGDIVEAEGTYSNGLFSAWILKIERII